MFVLLVLILAGSFYYLKTAPIPQVLVSRQRDTAGQVPRQFEDDAASSSAAVNNQVAGPAAEPSVRGWFFGDLMLDRHVGEKIKAKSLAYLFEPLINEGDNIFSGADLVAANLEGAVTDRGEHKPPQMAYDFAFAPELIGQLKTYGFNFFNLANNHITDQGEAGFKETKKNLEDLGIAFSGCPDRQVGECSKRIIDIAGTKVGLIGFSAVYGQLDRKEAERLTRETMAKADFVIINFHWGREYEHRASEVQKKLAHALIDAGADALIGHHPHVVQGVEVYRGRPIFYSLGNFIFDQYFSADTQEGLAVQLKMAPGRLEAELLPLKSSGSRVRLMEEAERKVFFDKLAGWSSLAPEPEKELRSGTLRLSEN